MIPCNQLRIGNYAEGYGSDLLCVGVTENYFNYKEKGTGNYNAIPLRDMKPIKVTDDILKKFGFIYEPYKSHIGRTPEETAWAENVVEPPFTYYHYKHRLTGCILPDDNKTSALKHLHWLQNWHYFKTGIELILSE